MQFQYDQPISRLEVANISQGEIEDMHRSKAAEAISHKIMKGDYTVFEEYHNGDKRASTVVHVFRKGNFFEARQKLDALSRSNNLSMTERQLVADVVNCITD